MCVCVCVAPPDVWGFGILMWELASARKAYHDKQKGNVMFLVTSGRGQLEAPDHAPETYKVPALPAWCSIPYPFVPHMWNERAHTAHGYMSTLTNAYCCFKLPLAAQDIMSLCLQYAANQRPTFAQLQDMLHAAIRNI